MIFRGAIILVFAVLISLVLVTYPSIKQEVYVKLFTCGDETPYESCSNIKPFYCYEGTLVTEANYCGCPEDFIVVENHCEYDTLLGSKLIRLNYTLRGEDGFIDFLVYDEMADYLFELPRSLFYKGDDRPLREEFKMLNINEAEQRKLLLPLVAKIQNITNDKDDQFRIAVSLVQKIPFGFSNKTTRFGSYTLEYSRYSYEVLYDQEGICGEKSALLAFLLKELGYETVIFYYLLENHEAVGVKCPDKYSVKNTGYCFIETGGSSIITDEGLEFFGGVKLLSQPQILFISEGNSLGYNLYEYSDSKYFAKIRESLKDGRINRWEEFKLNKLNEKYHIEERYNL